MTAAKQNAAGRKALYGEAMKGHTVRMDDKRWDKLQRLGGVAWLRGKIDEEPTPRKRK